MPLVFLLLLAFQEESSPRILGEVGKPLDEVSSLAAGIAGHLWVHNDSGDGPQFYALATDGRLLATFVLDGYGFMDAEDMAAGPGPEPGRRYLFLGDVGNNKAHDGDPRPSVNVFRVPEPLNIPEQPTTVNIPKSEVSVLLLYYPDGAHDVETLLLDPLTGDLYLCTKRDPRSRIYHLPKPGPGHKAYDLKFVGEMSITGTTAGDVSPDGRHILIKTYMGVFHYRRDPDQPLWQALVNAKPSPLPGYVLEPQGEAIAFDVNGKGFYTLSEARNVRKVPLYYYPFGF